MSLCEFSTSPQKSLLALCSVSLMYVRERGKSTKEWCWLMIWCFVADFDRKNFVSCSELRVEGRKRSGGHHERSVAQVKSTVPAQSTPSGGRAQPDQVSLSLFLPGQAPPVRAWRGWGDVGLNVIVGRKGFSSSLRGLDRICLIAKGICVTHGCLIIAIFGLFAGTTSSQRTPSSTMPQGAE